jgi:hypothetical protein
MMFDAMYAERMLEQLARDRDAYVLRRARLAAAMEGARVSHPAARSRRYRDRVARLLKALATRLAPPVASEAPQTNAAPTALS